MYNYSAVGLGRDSVRRWVLLLGLLYFLPFVNAFDHDNPPPPEEATCGVGPNGLIWEDYKHDLTSYSWIGHPFHAGRSCKGLDASWGYCGFIAGDSLSKFLAPIDGLQESCPLGFLIMVAFNRIFLLVDERWSSLFLLWDSVRR
ncbi:unnamed protein product, partial [Amoebophrya sp. A25]|eukprot:GSA25T00004183001.1